MIECLCLKCLVFYVYLSWGDDFLVVEWWEGWGNYEIKE